MAIKKRSLDLKNDIKEFYDFVNEKLEARNENLRTKNERERNLKVAKIVLLLQSFGMRINETLKLKKDDLIEIVNGNNLEYIVSKSKKDKETGKVDKESIIFRVIEFGKYENLQDVYELLKSECEYFVNKYHSGVFPDNQKKEMYLEVVTPRIIEKRVSNFENKLKKDRYTKDEIKKKVTRFKREKKNKKGFIMNKNPKYIIKFTSFFNRLLKEKFDSIILDKDRIDDDGEKKVGADLKNAKRTSKYTSHSLRAGFIVSQSNDGKNIIQIQTDIGHKRSEQTAEYISSGVDIHTIHNKVDNKVDDVVKSSAPLVLKKYISKDGSVYEYSNMKELKELKDMGL